MLDYILISQIKLDQVIVAFPALVPQSIIIAVSYTHLDVYKRQERVLYRSRHSNPKHCCSCIPVNPYVLHAQAVAAICLQEKPDDESR